MLRVNSTFDTANSAATKSPVVLININGLTNDYCNATFSGIAGTDKKFVSNIKISGGRIDLARFETGSFGIDFDIVDQDTTFFTELNSNNIIGQKVTIKIGFQDLTEANFMQLPICYVTDWQVLPDNITFRITARDRKHKEFRRKIFRSITVTETTEVLDAAELGVDVTDDTGFAAGDGAVWGRSTNTYIKIDDEIMRYTAVAANTFTVTRGDLGTTASTHAIGAEVRECYLIQETPIEFLIQILSSFNNTDGNPEVFGEALPSGWGLNFSVSDELDILQMFNEYVKWEYIPGTVSWIYNWVVWEERDAGRFIQDQILKLLPAFFIYTENGKLGVKIWDFRIQNEGATYITWADDNFTLSMRSEYKDMVTDLNVGESFKPGTRSHGSVVNVRPTASDYDRNTVTFRPEATNYPLVGTPDFEKQMRHRYFRNIYKPHVKVKGRCFLEKWIHQGGDIIALTNDTLLDFNNDSRVWTAETVQLLELNVVIPSPEEAFCEFEALAYDHGVGLASYLTFEIGNETDMDDETMTFDATDDEVVQAADGNWDPSVLITNLDTMIVIYTIEADLPGNNDSDEFVGISLWAGEQDGADIDAVNRYNDKKPVYYNASWTGTLRQSLVLFIPNNTFDLERIKADYYQRSAGVGDRLANMKLVQVKILKSSMALSEAV